MRSWLRENGYTVKDRGRVPAEFVAAYKTRTPAVAASDGSAAEKSRKGRTVNNVEVQRRRHRVVPSPPLDARNRARHCARAGHVVDAEDDGQAA
jgi:hypothetical protein